MACRKAGTALRHLAGHAREYGNSRWLPSVCATRHATCRRRSPLARACLLYLGFHELEQLPTQEEEQVLWQQELQACPAGQHHGSCLRISHSLGCAALRPGCSRKSGGQLHLQVPSLAAGPRSLVQGACHYVPVRFLDGALWRENEEAVRVLGNRHMDSGHSRGVHLSEQCPQTVGDSVLASWQVAHQGYQECVVGFWRLPRGTGKANSAKLAPRHQWLGTEKLPHQAPQILGHTIWGRSVHIERGARRSRPAHRLQRPASSVHAQRPGTSSQHPGDNKTGMGDAIGWASAFDVQSNVSETAGC